MNNPNYWLCFWDGHQSRLEPTNASSREAAVLEGLELSRDHLTAVFNSEIGFTHAQMLELAEVMPPIGSPLWQPTDK
ncbi:MAG: hypothetical protein DBW85_06910 [Synechococcus sp. MED-G71]|jgi:hypothetical protein|nr:MAG: hypothetical protein DBW85_06910 [Synechococcus sp. MED-G71]|tara:strand:+ start:991 stop:1221 length:231 start_codon:yes stop_codon:yes gene_type:complete